MEVVRLQGFVMRSLVVGEGGSTMDARPCQKPLRSPMVEVGKQNVTKDLGCLNRAKYHFIQSNKIT